MSTDGGSFARTASGATVGSGHVPRDDPAAPDTLIRTINGHITAWSPGMQQRYGFTSLEACGCISHHLLRTIFPQTLEAIGAALLDRRAWSGGLMHRHADGSVVLAINHWYVHHGAGDHAEFITEVHSNIADAGDARHRRAADLLVVLALELSERLAAIGQFVDQSRQTLQLGWPNIASLRETMAEASAQIARGEQGVTLLRELANDMRDTA